MKKSLTNQAIEGFLTTLNKADSFVYTVKMPQALRQAIRINVNTLNARHQVYQEGRLALIKGYVEKELATMNDDGTVTIKPEGIPLANAELTELALVQNELEFEVVDADIIDGVLRANNLTLTEEDVLLFFSKEEEKNKE